MMNMGTNNKVALEEKDWFDDEAMVNTKADSMISRPKILKELKKIMRKP